MSTRFAVLVLLLTTDILKANVYDDVITETCTFNRLVYTCERKENALTAIPSNIPTNATKIIISRHQIRKIYDHDFPEGFTELLELRLPRNGIEEISEGAFKNLTKLRFLSLFSNSLTRLGQHFFNWNKDLVFLIIASNPSLELESCSLSGLTKLTHLVADRTRINFSEDLFVGRDCPDGKIPTASLRELNLRYSVTESFDVSLLSLFDQLRRLNIGQCGIQTSEANLTLWSSPSMEELLITQFSVTFFRENTLENLVNLELIDIQGQSLYFFPKHFLQSDHFRGEINIKQTSFTNLPALAFEGMKYVRKIEVSSSLQSIHPQAFRLLSNLEVLDLKNNYLITLPPNMIVDFSSTLKELDLENNQLICDCSLYNLANYVIEMTDQAVIVGECQMSSEHYFMNITDHASSNYTCVRESGMPIVREPITTVEVANTSEGLTSFPQSTNEITVSSRSVPLSDQRYLPTTSEADGDLFSTNELTTVALATELHTSFPPHAVSLMSNVTNDVEGTQGGPSSTEASRPTYHSIHGMDKSINPEPFTMSQISRMAGERDALALFNFGGKMILYISLITVVLCVLGVVSLVYLKMSKVRSSRVDVSSQLTCMTERGCDSTHDNK